MNEQQALELAQQQEAMNAAAAGIGIGIAVFYLLFIGFMVACGWRIFSKAGQPGWAVIVPFYNLYIMLKIVGRPVWWMVLFFIPLLNLIPAILLSFDLAKSFGKGAGYGIGLLLLGIVFYPMLAFGSATYVGPSAGGGSAAPAPAAA